MTKTKRQLRAEAVERLKDCKCYPMDIVLALAGCRMGTSDYSAERDVIIDLLTDDEYECPSDPGEAGVACVDAFIAEHSNDDSAPKSGVSDPDGGSNVAYIAPDSREKLEADANAVAIDYWHRERTWDDANDLKRDVIALLDRQAAITQHEITERWAEHLHPIERKCGDLRRKVDELEANNDRLAKLLSKSLEEYSILEAERDEAVEAYDAHMAAHDAWHEAEDITYTRNRFSVLEQAKNERIAELTAERDELKEEIAKYEHDCGLLFDEKHKLTAERDELQRQLDTMRDVTREFRDERDNLQLKLDILKAHGVDIVSSADGGYEVYNVAIDERNKYREKLSRAIGLAREIGDLGK